jgi:hypothetical protein
MNKTQETRKQKRLEKLGSNHPVCIICAENDWRCLEEHHIAGQHYDDCLSVICRNCHRKLSDDQKDHPVKILPTPTPTSVESIGHLLIGLADLFALLVEKLHEYGLHLIETAKDMKKLSA